MIELIPKSKKNVLVFKASGELEDRDHEEVLGPSLRNTLRHFDHAHMIFLFEEDRFDWKLSDSWSPESFADRYGDKVDKVALVSGSRWKKWVEKLRGIMGPDKVRSFDAGHPEEAWEWAEETKVA